MYKFLSNLYNPSLPDAAEKLISEKYGQKKDKRQVKNIDDLSSRYEMVEIDSVIDYINNVFLKDKIIGDPVPPSNSLLSVEDLKSMGYVGVYEPETPLHRFSAPSCGTGINEPSYPKIATYDKNGKIVKIISNEHTI